MPDIKTIATRLNLKIDTFENWTSWYAADKTKLATTVDPNAENFDISNYANMGAALKLGRGEVAFCEIPTQGNNETTAPTMLFKVGDGERRFYQLKWASATAADVYSWAKAKTVSFVTVEAGDGVQASQKIVFKDASENPIYEVDLTGYFATAAEMTDIKSRMDAVEAVLNGASDGDDESLAGKVAANTKAIQDINTVVGTSNGATVFEEITELYKADTALQLRVVDIENAYSSQSESITDLKSRADSVDSRLDEIDISIQDVDDRISGLEVFFENADANGSDVWSAGADGFWYFKGEKTEFEVTVGNPSINDDGYWLLGSTNTNKQAELNTGLYDALDTLREIQEYITTEGKAADILVQDVSELRDQIHNTDTGILTKLNTLSATDDTQGALIEEHTTKLEALETLTAGFETSTIKEAIDTVSDTASTNASNIDGIQETVGSLQEVLNDQSTGLGATHQIANEASAKVDAIAADYLKQVDLFIIDCGNATTCIHTE